MIDVLWETLHSPLVFNFDIGILMLEYQGKVEVFIGQEVGWLYGCLEQVGGRWRCTVERHAGSKPTDFLL